MLGTVLDTIEWIFVAVSVILMGIYFLDRRHGLKVDIGRYAQAQVARSTTAIRNALSPRRSPKNGPPITVLFGTQSGTAESFAEGFSKEARSRGFASKLSEIELYKYHDRLRDEKLVIVYVSTHGEGHPPDSVADFYEWLMSDEREPSLLSSVTYAVFALGNRQYEHFNFVGKEIDKRFSLLGARRLCDVCLGDDNGSIEEDNENWRLKVWPMINQFHGIVDNDEEDVHLPVYEPSFRVIYSNELPDVGLSFRNRRSSAKSVSTHRIVGVLDVQELLKHPNDMSSIMHIVLDLKGRSLPYETAHNICVHPRNNFRVISKLCQRLEYDANAIFTLKGLNGNQKKHPVPSPCTVRDALLWHMDIMSPPRKSFIGFLSQYARDPKEKSRLIRMALHAGHDDFHEHVIEDKKTVPEMLEMFPSVYPPLEHFLEECPPLQARWFTIASSALAHPEQIHLTVTHSRTKKDRGRVHDGVCSTYLKNLRVGKDTCNIFTRKSTFNVPEDSSTPIIMFGAGSGVAPFRAFVQEGLYRHNNKMYPNGLPEWHLFFGCRDPNNDFLYEEEFREAEQLGVLKGLHMAFSRVDPDRKLYVQDVLRQKHELVWDLIENRDAIIFVCGSMNMGKGVRDALRDVVMQNSKFSEDQSADYLHDLANQNRFISELWE